MVAAWDHPHVFKMSAHKAASISGFFGLLCFHSMTVENTSRAAESCFQQISFTSYNEGTNVLLKRKNKTENNKNIINCMN